MDCMSSPLALAEPVPLTVAILNAKSLIIRSSLLLATKDSPDAFRSSRRDGPSRFSKTENRQRTARIGDEEIEFAHIPRCCRTALRAQPTVQTHIFIFHHHTLRLRQRVRRVERLRKVQRRGGK